MKKVTILLVALFAISLLPAQQTGYYNGVDGKEGDELKAALHDIIKGHTSYSYYSSKFVLALSDQDPNNSENVIQVYTGFSHDAGDYGSSGLKLNREHVWAKSHGNFTDWPPMYSDVHNLKPSASSVNMDKSNLDFDNGGIQHPIATGCYYSDTTWEPRDEVKGDIARIIFYMATRYEGGQGEIDLEVVDNNHSFPNAQHGKLSTLIEWNELDPPDDFERNRNNVIESYQHNRNPYIDNPQWVEMIWNGGEAGPITIDNISINPTVVIENEPVTVSAEIASSEGDIDEVILLWGYEYSELEYDAVMNVSGNQYSANIPGQTEGTTIYYRIEATDPMNEYLSVVYNYYVPKTFTGELVSIYDIQGQTDDSPYSGQVVSTSGVVTGSFGSNYFIQDGTGLWNGLFIYESGRNPSIGDSVIITGKITEYYGKTEMVDIEDYYFISSNNTLPAPVIAQTGSIEEGHESVLTKVIAATCTDDAYQNNYYMWTVDDGSGELRIHNTSIFEYEPTEGLSYNITGPMNYDFDEWKIELRYEDDVVESSDITGPTVIAVEPVISTNIKVMFDEDVDQATAENADNYSLDKGITVEEASQHAFNKAQVNLTVSTMPDDSYILTIKNVEDESGNVMEDQEYGFTFVGIEEVIFNGEIEIYPNPADKVLNLSFTANSNTDLLLKVSDISGRVVFEEKNSITSGSNNLSIDVSELSEGIYLLNISEGNSSLTYRVLIK